MLDKRKDFNEDKELDFIKNPSILEFLNIPECNYVEKDLENCLIQNMKKFLMELGKGYAFVTSQKRIHTEKEDYFIDLVFYNYILKCFILIDLKMGKLTHQDVGQMDMYVQMYDEIEKQEDDNPTIGILLCSDTDDCVARYSRLHSNNQLFAEKYKTYLPTEQELKAEIERQRIFFQLQYESVNGVRTGSLFLRHLICIRTLHIHHYRFGVTIKLDKWNKIPEELEGK